MEEAAYQVYAEFAAHPDDFATMVIQNTQIPIRKELLADACGSILRLNTPCFCGDLDVDTCVPMGKVAVWFPRHLIGCPKYFVGCVLQGRMQGLGYVVGAGMLGQLVSQEMWKPLSIDEWSSHPSRLTDDRYVYKGILHNGRFHGPGITIFHNDDGSIRGIYSGQYANGKMEGKGNLSYRVNNVFFTYDGDFWNDRFHGEGTWWSREGNEYYNGEFENGKRHGLGKLVQSDLIFEGVFRQDVPCLPKSALAIPDAIPDDHEERQRLCDLHDASPVVGSVPRCVVCLEAMHHGDVSWAWVPCGHRILCGPCGVTHVLKLNSCPLCRQQGTLLRLY